MTRRRKIFWVLGLTLASVLPVYANNPPQPDGLFSLLLIFPVAIAAWRMAGTTLPASSKLRSVLVVLLMVLAVLIAMAGDEIGIFGILAILIYACVRGIQVMRYGKGGKRFVLGAVIILFALLAIGDYVASLTYLRSPSFSESSAISAMRELSTAEEIFASSDKTIRDKTTKHYATLEELQGANLIDDSFLAAKDRKGYRYGEFLTPAKDRFVFYAVPVRYPDRHLRSIVPGGSLLSAFRPKEELRVTGTESFAVDETGIIRSSTKTDSAPQTREEVEKWGAPN